MCGCDKNKKVKYRTGGNGGELGETENIIKPLCKKVKFTLIITLNFDNKTSKKLKSHFNSKPDVGSCNFPDSKDFTKAYRKLMKKYSDSLPKDSLSKATSPQVVNKNTQVSSTVGEVNVCTNGQCECTYNLFSKDCGTGNPGNKCKPCAKVVEDDKIVAICWTKCG
jgi:hypothetical protein